MYNPFYGFKENPFNQTPDSQFFFPSAEHRHALDSLIYAVKQRKGFVVITGEIGSGKTTVSRTLLRKLDPNVKAAVITNTSLSPKGVIRMILEDLDMPYKDGSKEQLLIQLNDYLIQMMRQDRNFLLIIDEAQNLSPSCLEEVRMLSNLETEKEKLLQLVLIGQPELKRKLALTRLEQLRQRIAVHYHLKPLGLEDTKSYICHRLNTARLNGRNYNDLFEDAALDAIYQYSRGIPRIINNICDHALLNGYIAEAKVITQAMALEAVESVLNLA